MPGQAKLYLPKFRVSFPSVFETQKLRDGTDTKKYTVTALFDLAELKTQPAELAKVQALNTALQKLHKDSYPTLPVPTFLKKGEDKITAEGKPYDGYHKGIVYIAMNSQRRPGIVGRDGKTPILTEDGFYAGCYALAQVHIYKWRAYKGVGVGLDFLQFVTDGEPLGGGAGSIDGVFDAISSPDDNILGEQEAPATDDMESFLG